MLRVVRVGGSLLNWSGLPDALRHWLASEPAADNVFIAGGGAWVELLREANGRFHLSEESAHWLAIRAMSVTAELLHHVTGIPLATCLPQLEGREAAILDVYLFLKNDEPHSAGCRLPASWEVTSDSIAARVAHVLGADELVLLKSQTAPPEATATHLSSVNYTDSFFPQIAGSLNVVRYVNLRDDSS